MVVEETKMKPRPGTIVLSGMDDDDLVIELLEMGAVDFIRKPFNIKELVVRVRRHLPAVHLSD